MGVWGTGTLDSDAAYDFLIDVQQSGVPKITLALSEPSGRSPYPVLAAAEIVAAAFGRPLKDDSSDVPELAALYRDAILADPDVLGAARRAVRNVRSDPEASDGWIASQDKAEWISNLSDLEDRLSESDMQE